MGAYRYCHKCERGQDAITVEEIAMSYGEIKCEHCDTAREDDTQEERMRILAEEIVELKKVTNEKSR